MASLPDDVKSREEWRPIAEWPWYEVSSLGRVRSLDRWVDRSNGGRQWRPGKVLKPGRQRSGHLSVCLVGEGRRRTYLVHFLVISTFTGPRPPRMECRHLDGNPSNNDRDNLEWGTPVQNSQDSVQHGTLRALKQWTCSRGHMLAMPNLQDRAFARGERICKACSTAHSYVHYRKKQYGRDYDIEVVAARMYLKILEDVLKGDDEGAAA